MSDYITLLGAENVQRAASQMQSAADAMQRAASSMEDAFNQHQRFLDDWLYRLQSAMPAERKGESK